MTFVICLGQEGTEVDLDRDVKVADEYILKSIGLSTDP